MSLVIPKISSSPVTNINRLSKAIKGLDESSPMRQHAIEEIRSQLTSYIDELSVILATFNNNHPEA